MKKVVTVSSPVQAAKRRIVHISKTGGMTEDVKERLGKELLF